MLTEPIIDTGDGEPLPPSIKCGDSRLAPALPAAAVNPDTSGTAYRSWEDKDERLPFVLIGHVRNIDLRLIPPAGSAS